MAWSNKSLLETGSLPSVKNQALGKVPHSAKNCTRQRVLCQVRGTRQRTSCRVPDFQQKRGTRHRLPRVTVLGHVLLCRVPAVRHSANILFLKILCRVPLTRRSAKIQYFFKMSLLSAPVKALGKEKISKKIQKPLCRAPYSWHSAKTPFAKCHAPALGKVLIVF